MAGTSPAMTKDGFPAKFITHQASPSPRGGLFCAVQEETMQAPATDSPDHPSPSARRRARGIDLPPAARPVGDSTPTIIVGNLLCMCGQVPWIAGDLKFKGKIGAELNVEQGYQAFRLSAATP